MSVAKVISLKETRRHRVFLTKQPRFEMFSPAEVAILAGLYSEPLEYVDHELFDRLGAEVLVFGRPAELLQHGSRFMDADRDLEEFASLLEGDTPTAGQEVVLFQRFNLARKRLAMLACALDAGVLTDRQAREMAAWAHRVVTIRDFLTRVTLPLVGAMAKQSRFQYLDLCDLVSEGNCALLRAVLTFDCARGYRFSTYACRAILKSFARVVLRTARYRNHFPVEFDSMHEPNTYADSRREIVRTDCVHELRTILAGNRAKLSEIEQMVIRARFALDGDADGDAVPKTLDEIGEMIGVTKERVRQIQNKALRKLRHDMEKNYLAA